MEPAAKPIVDAKYYPVFGALVYCYASVETAIKFCAAAMMKADLDDAFIAFAPYTATSLANVAKVLAEERLNPEMARTMKGLVSKWQSHTDLRTYVAHYRWRKGTRPDSIRPTYWDIRSGKLRVGGIDQTERDYTVEEIGNAAIALADLNEEIKAFLKSSGLMDIIDPKTDDASPANA